MNDDREWAIVLTVLGAAVEVGLMLVLAGSALPTWVRLILLALLPVGFAIFFWLRSLLPGCRDARRPTRRPSRRLQDLHKARGAIDQGWFVSFTAGPYPTATDPRGQYATAIAEVDHVDGDEVHLRWRDRANLPTGVPLQLLDANEVVRFRNGRHVRTRNEGLHIPPRQGAIAASSGWNAHRASPWQAAFVRYGDLTPEYQQAMEAEADLATYDIDGLKKP